MWQDIYGITWAEEEGVLFIKGGGVTESPFMLPPFAGKDAKFVDGLQMAKEWFKENQIPFLLKGYIFFYLNLGIYLAKFHKNSYLTF